MFLKNLGIIARTCFSAKDNYSIDIGRVLWFLGCISFIIFEGYVVFCNKAFDMTDFGMGFGGLLMTGGGALILKNKTEKDTAPIDSPQPTKTDELPPTRV